MVTPEQQQCYLQISIINSKQTRRSFPTSLLACIFSRQVTLNEVNQFLHCKSAPTSTANYCSKKLLTLCFRTKILTKNNTSFLTWRTSIVDLAMSVDQFHSFSFKFNHLEHMHSYNWLTHSFPMHPFSTPWKHQKTVRFSGGRENVHWEKMG